MARINVSGGACLFSCWLSEGLLTGWWREVSGSAEKSCPYLSRVNLPKLANAFGND
jgi:hypothetical protein